MAGSNSQLLKYVDSASRERKSIQQYIDLMSKHSMKAVFKNAALLLHCIML